MVALLTVRGPLIDTELPNVVCPDTYNVLFRVVGPDTYNVLFRLVGPFTVKVPLTPKLL